MYKLYSRISDHETVLECWGASTKHPDSVFLFSNFVTTTLVSKESQIPAWIWECASRMVFPFHSYCLAQFGIELFEGWW